MAIMVPDQLDGATEEVKEAKRIRRKKQLEKSTSRQGEGAEREAAWMQLGWRRCRDGDPAKCAKIECKKFSGRFCVP